MGQWLHTDADDVTLAAYTEYMACGLHCDQQWQPADMCTDRFTPLPCVNCVRAAADRPHVSVAAGNAVDQTGVVKFVVSAVTSRVPCPSLTDGIPGAVDGITGRAAVHGAGGATCGQSRGVRR